MKKITVLGVILRLVGFVLLREVATRLGQLIFQGILFLRFSHLPEEEFFAAANRFGLRYHYEFNFAINLLFLLLLFLAVRILKEWDTLGFRAARPSENLTGVAIGLGAYHPAASLVTLSVILFARYETSAQEYLQYQEAVAQTDPSLLFELLTVCLLGPLIEEILCRGVVQNNLLRVMRPAFAVTLSGLFFSLLHGNLYQIVYTLPFGILLGYVAYRFDSVWPSVLAHVVYNTVNYYPRLPQLLGIPSTSPWAAYLLQGISVILLFFTVLAVILLTWQWEKKRPKVLCPPSVPVPSPETLPPEEKEKESMPDWLVVGLGNPGSEYENTRHNAGFLALEALADQAAIRVDRLKFKALTGEGVIEGKKVLLMKPQTFMNLSGEAVGEAAAFYKIPTERILVIYDDVNFSVGSFRIRKNGSSGGHNGIKSLLEHLPDDGFLRIKMGVGAPPEGWDMAKYVLGRFSPQEKDVLEKTLIDATQAVRYALRGETERAMQEFNGKIRS